MRAFTVILKGKPARGPTSLPKTESWRPHHRGVLNAVAGFLKREKPAALGVASTGAPSKKQLQVIIRARESYISRGCKDTLLPFIFFPESQATANIVWGCLKTSFFFFFFFFRDRILFFPIKSV